MSVKSNRRKGLAAEALRTLTLLMRPAGLPATSRRRRESDEKGADHQPRRESDFFAARDAWAAWDARVQAREGEVMSERLSVERWPLGDTDERSPMYCLYLDGQRIGDVWEQSGGDYLVRLTEQVQVLTEALEAWEQHMIGSYAHSCPECSAGFRAALAAVKEETRNE